MPLTILFAIFLGIAFGVVLQRIGASNAQLVIDMLRLKNLHLLKVILLAIGVSSIAVFLISTFAPGVPHFSVKTAYSGVIIGGIIFGAGFALSGYCPGTALAAIGELKKDAAIFFIGGLLGALVFTLVYGSIKNSWLYTKLFGGKATLANTEVAKFTSILDFAPALAIAGSIALFFIAAAWLLDWRETRSTNKKQVVTEK